MARPRLNRKCSVEGCENKHQGLGFCQKHYMAHKYKTDAEFRKQAAKRNRKSRRKNKDKVNARNRAYYQRTKGAETIEKLRNMPRKECSEEGCDRVHFGRGLCQKHYQRMWYNTNEEAREKKKIAVKKWQSENREKMIGYQQKYSEARRKKPAKFKLDFSVIENQPKRKKITSKTPMQNAEAINEMQDIMFNMGRKWKDEDQL